MSFESCSSSMACDMEEVSSLVLNGSSQMQLRPLQRLHREMGAAQGQMPRREEGRRSSEDKQEQNKASLQLALSESSECTEGTQRKVWSLIFLLFGMRLVTCRKISPARPSMDEEEDDDWGEVVP